MTNSDPNLILYHYFRSSTSYRVRIGLHWKNLKFQEANINLAKNGGEQHQPQYRRLNPAGEVPSLVHDGRVISQSMAILQYLDEVFPQQRLFPQDPFEKAKVLQFCEGINCAHSLSNLKVLQYLEAKHGATAENKNQWVAEWMGRIFKATETLLESTAGTYSFGGSFSAADIFLIPHIYSAKRFSVDLSPYPILQRVNENGLKLEAVMKAHPHFQSETPPELKGIL